MQKDKDARKASPIGKVAVIGVGRMGRPMARRIHDEGFHLTVCDTTQANLVDFSALGVRTTIKPRDCADCDVVIVLVATPDQLRTVTMGTEGLRVGMGGGKPRYLVVMSTVSPTDMTELESSFSDMPVHIVDAPISGGVVGAEQGTLTVLVGGAQTHITALQPLFDAVGKKVFHCGPLGAGQTTKIVNNILAISNLMISAEAYRIALSNGLNWEQLMPALEAGSGRNFMSKGPGDAQEVYAAWTRSVEAYHAVQTINRKDIDLALSIAPSGLSSPALESLRKLLDQTDDETLANWRMLGGAGQG